MPDTPIGTIPPRRRAQGQSGSRPVPRNRQRMHKSGFRPHRLVRTLPCLAVSLACAGALAQGAASAAAQAASAAASAPAPMSGRRLPVGPGSAGLAVSADGRRVFVTDNTLDALDEVDLDTARLLHAVRGPLAVDTKDGCPDNFCRGVGAVGVALSPDGRYAYVSSMRPDSLSKVDLAAARVLWSRPVQRFPQEVAVSPDGRQVWTFNLVANSISTLDAATGAPAGRPIALQGGSARGRPFGRPAGFALSPDGKRLYVTSGLTQSLDVYDTRTRRRTGRSELGEPWTIRAAAGGQVWAQYEDGLVAFDGASLEPARALRYCRELTSYQFALSPDGQRVALSLPREGAVLVADLGTGLLTNAYTTRRWPRALAFTPDGRRLVALDGAGPEAGDDTTDADGAAVFDLDDHAGLAAFLAQSGELFCQPASERE